MVDIIRRGSQSSPSLIRSPIASLLRELVGFDPLQQLAPVYRSMSQDVFVPAFEVKENKDEYTIKADLPGVREDDIQINVSGNRLTVGGKRVREEKQEDESYYLSETEYGEFNRSFTLPDIVDADNTRAEMKNGQLLIHVPKRAEMHTKQIQVKGEGQGQTQKNDKQKQPPRAQA